MLKALCIGAASYDISVVVDSYPTEESKERFINKVGCPSGTSSNCAYLLAKWGIGTTFAGVIGNDIFGNRIKKEFEDVNIDTRFIETSFEKDTVITFNIINKASSNKTSFTVADEFVKLKKYTYDFTPDIIISDGNDTYASKVAIQSYPKSLSVLDMSRATSEILELAKYVKYIIFSRSIAESLSGVKLDYNDTKTLVTCYQKLKNKFPKAEIIITLGSGGALYCFNNQIKISPALKSTIADPTGAKDVFTGAFSYVIANGGDLEKATKYGNIAASLSLTNLGIRKSIPSLEVVDKLYVQNYE